MTASRGGGVGGRWHAGRLVKERAAGMRLGSRDEGSLARELAGVACRLHSGRAGSPAAAPARALARS